MTKLDAAMISTTAASARVTNDLRCGSFVLLTSQIDAWLLLAGELADEDRLRAGNLLAGGAGRLAITAQRAHALGLGVAVPGPPLLLPTPGDLATLFGLIDPTQPLEGWSRESLPAVSSETAGSTLATGMLLLRGARLLPALLAWSLPATRAQELARGLGLSVFDVAHDDVSAATPVVRVADASVPLAGAEQARIVAFRPPDGSNEHLAIIIGKVVPAAPVLVRIHSECFTGDLLGSLRCDCGEQLRGAILEMGRRGAGVLLYLAQEGRGIGLVNKLRAYCLQDAGADTLEANEQLGFEADERDFAPAAEMLRQLGIGAVRLMTNNPAKVAALEAEGIVVAERVAHAFAANDHNHRYLRTKAQRAGHLF